MFKLVPSLAGVNAIPNEEIFSFFMKALCFISSKL